jgi:hypothetical protein
MIELLKIQYSTVLYCTVLIRNEKVFTESGRYSILYGVIYVPPIICKSGLLYFVTLRIQ